MTRTIHVFHTDDGWAVKKEGQRASLYRTRRTAFDSAVRRAKKSKGAQVVVHGVNGGVTARRRYGLPKIQVAPGKLSKAGEKVVAAIPQFVLDRLRNEYIRATQT
jgi:hypothetical protein